MKMVIQMSYRREKWADKLEIVAPQGLSMEQEIEVRARAVGPWTAPHRVEEFAKSPWEMQVIEQANKALNQVLDMLGLKQRYFSAERFHIIEPYKFKLLVQSDDTAGEVMFGHMYIQRREKQLLVGDLIHELAHAVSYHVFRAMVVKNRGKNFNFYSCPVSGFRRFFSNGVLRREGFNEAVTEMLAHAVRRLFAGSSDCLDNEEKEELLRRWAYYRQVRVVEAVIDEVAGGDIRKINDMIFRDYITGTNRFFRRLYRKMPGTARVLRRMGKDKKQAVAAAKELGMDKLARELKKLALDK